ncbi:dihydropteroate synthase [Hydrogenophaga sp. 5NK40-0174]|uniref:dihydropteroate synthase n=1 Tax=Hydrogenophaga sp. 5NK40-0174 TaxID=3127649 RepID=UPI00333FF8E8
MGIVNVTPDSFSDGGKYLGVKAALAHAERLLDEGAHILDIGGESTRPGSPPVPLEAERERVMPVLEQLLKLGAAVSLDTYKAELMQEALDMGVDIINDIWALRQPHAAEVIAQHPNCGVCLMHMHRNPQTMQSAPMSGNAVGEVVRFLQERAASLTGAGVQANRIVLDPGIGFGKTVEQNFELLARQRELRTLGFPVLAGWSRKSSLGVVTGRDSASSRVTASVAAALIAVQNGASVVRVHDVRATADALAVWAATRGERQNAQFPA